MPQLPAPATSGDVWGNTLNTFLTVALDNTTTDGGKVKPTAIKSTTTDSGKVLAVDNTGASNWINAQDVIVNSTVQQLITPAGAVLPFYMTSAPAGWLVCNGSTVNTADYPILSAILQQKSLFFFAVNQSNSVLTATNHTFNTGDTVKMDVQTNLATAPSLPAGFNNTTTYYVKKLTNNTLSLHFSAADAAAGTNQFTVTNIGSGTFYIFNAIGFTSTVLLPELRGEFIRGLDLGRGVNTPTTQNFSATITLGSNQLTITTASPDMSTLFVGMGVTGTGISANTYITAINATTKVVTLSSSATVLGTNAVYVFAGRVLGSTEKATGIGEVTFSHTIYVEDSDQQDTSIPLQTTSIANQGTYGGYVNRVRPRNLALLYCIKY